jgi:hypothetical protein
MEQFRKHPFVTLAITVFSVVAALITFFHELTGEHFLPFLKREGWLDVPFWYSSLLIVLGVAILVLQGSVIKAFCQFRRWGKVRWLETLLAADDQNMEQRIRLEPYSTGAKLHLNAPSPYVHIFMYFLNISVHSLTLEEKIKGRFTFDDHPLDDARILWRKDQTKRGEIKHGDRYYVVLEQPLSPPVVDRIQKNGTVTLGGKFVEVCFTYRDTAGNLHPRYVKVDTWITLKEQRD